MGSDRLWLGYKGETWPGKESAVELKIEDGNVPTIDVSGEIDHFVCPQLNDKIDELAAKSNKLMLDFSNVSYLDSAGVAAVISAIQQISLTGGSVVLIADHPDVVHILDLVGLTSDIKGFRLVAERDEALNILEAT